MAASSSAVPEVVRSETSMVVTGQALGDPVITGWSTVSPLGMRTEELTAGLRVGRRAVTTIDWPEWSGPVSEACLIPGFTVAGALGGKGTRSMDRATGIAVSAVGVLLNRQRLDRGGDT